MNIFNKLTLQMLRKNKTRTIVTIMGIILATAMICSVTTFCSSILNFLIEAEIFHQGDWHGSMKMTDMDGLETISSAEETENVVYCRNVGYAKVESENPRTPYLYLIAGSGQDYLQTMPVHLTEGKYPENPDEILISERLWEDGGVKYEIGDDVSLDIGVRVLDGELLWQDESCMTENEKGKMIPNGEVLSVTETNTYTVVGFFDSTGEIIENWNAPGYTAITVTEEKMVDGIYNVFFKMKEPKNIFEFMEKNVPTGQVNGELLAYLGVSKNEQTREMFYMLAAVFIGLIVYGAVTLIHNAFSISVSERTRQFGLLSSVGATKRQVRRMVLFEALMVGAAGIPIGIILGIGGVSMILSLMGNMFSSMVDHSVPMRICVSWEAVLVACVISLITILISAWAPALRASRVSAIEAIRQKADFRADDRPVNNSWLTYKLFGFPGMLASKHYKRNRKKYRTTIWSLFMSIVLSVSVASFAAYFSESAKAGLRGQEHDLRYYYLPDERINRGISPDLLLENMLDCEAVDDGAYVLTRGASCSVSEELFTPEVLGNVSTSVTGEGKQLSLSVVFVDDDSFKHFLSENKLNTDEFMNPDKPLGVSINSTKSWLDTEKDRYVGYDLLDTEEFEVSYTEIIDRVGYTSSRYVRDEDNNITGVEYLNYENGEKKSEIIPIEEATTEITLSSGAMIDYYPYFVTGGLDCTLLYPMSAFSTLYEGFAMDSCLYEYYMMAENHFEAFTQLEQMLGKDRLQTEELINHAEQLEEEENLVKIINVISYTFVAMISLIAVANVFNIISTNISLRRREFAMLKSVGLTDKGLNRIMNYECLIYGTKALIFGLPVSYGINYLIYRIISVSEYIEFLPQWGTMAIAAVSVFAVVSVTMLFSMSKIKEENTVDELRNENI